jgi:hypothetical protein
MSSKILIPFAAAMTCLGAVALSSTPASAYYPGYCYDHPYAPACLAGHVAPYVYHHEHYEHYHDHYHHGHDHDHDHHHDHDHDHHDHNHHH